MSRQGDPPPLKTLHLGKGTIPRLPFILSHLHKVPMSPDPNVSIATPSLLLEQNIVPFCSMASPSGVASEMTGTRPGIGPAAGAPLRLSVPFRLLPLFPRLAFSYPRFLEPLIEAAGQPLCPFAVSRTSHVPVRCG